MNVPYDIASGYRDIEAYREECVDRLRDTKECLMELAEDLIKVVDHADFCELDKAAEQIEELVYDIKYNADELRNIEHDYDVTL